LSTFASDKVGKNRGRESFARAKLLPPEKSINKNGETCCRKDTKHGIMERYEKKNIRRISTRPACRGR
jgi:hypothetical protein